MPGRSVMTQESYGRTLFPVKTLDSKKTNSSPWAIRQALNAKANKVSWPDEDLQSFKMLPKAPRERVAFASSLDSQPLLRSVNSLFFFYKFGACNPSFAFKFRRYKVSSFDGD